MFCEAETSGNEGGRVGSASSHSNGMIAAWAANLERRCLAALASHPAPHDFLALQSGRSQPDHLNRLHQEFAHAAVQMATTASINPFGRPAMLDKMKIDSAWNSVFSPFTALSSQQIPSTFYSRQVPSLFEKPRGRWCSMHVKIAWQMKKHQDTMDATALKNLPVVSSSPSSRPHELTPICFPIRNLSPLALKLTEHSHSSSVGTSTIVSQSMTSSYEKAHSRSKSRSPLNKNDKKLSKRRRPHFARVHRSNDEMRESVQLEQSFLARTNTVAENNSSSLIY